MISLARASVAQVIYLDHAATSWPKPPQVSQAMSEYLERAGGNPGRSGHRLSIAAGRIVYAAREAAAELFHVPDPLRIIFTLNATEAINIAIHGVVRPGDRVVATGGEHNAVMRPLRAMARRGVDLVIVPGAPDGSISLTDLAAAITPGTRLVVANHASNVTGALLPVEALAPVVRQAGALLLVDAAQSAGTVPLDVEAMHIDLLAFSGHKGLLGPPGTGGLVIGSGVDVLQLEPLVRGGTGSRSEFEEQPDCLPDRFESGTPNGVGLAGLGAGVRFVLERGVEAIRSHELKLRQALVRGLASLPGVVVHGPRQPAGATAVVSFTVPGRRVSEIGRRLDEESGVLCRVGLHCAPAAHKTIGTFPEGTVRLAPGPFTSPAEIEAAIAAVARVVRS